MIIANKQPEISAVVKRWKKIAALMLSVMMLAVFVLTGPVNEAASGGARSGSMVPLTGYGGAEYYKKTNYYVNIYGDNGQIVEVRQRPGGSRQKMYVLTDPASGTQQYAYCLASGLSFKTSAEFTAGGQDTIFSGYFNNLPETAQKGIAYASIYGYSDKNDAPDAPGPVEGTIGADFWMATQCVIWEYQQGIRVDAGARETHGLVEADNYYFMIKGKPAEKCYDYLLEQIRQASSVPGFAADDSSGWTDNIVTLDEIYSGAGTYTGSVFAGGQLPAGSYTVTDANGQAVPYLTVMRNGDRFTFRSSQALETPLNLVIKRTEDPGNEGAAVFFAPADTGIQTMLSASGRLSDPYKLYFSIQTRSLQGDRVTLNIQKTAANGRVSGIPFQLCWADNDGEMSSMTVYTDDAGSIALNLPIGDYPGAITTRQTGFAIGELVGDKYFGSLTGSSGNVYGTFSAYLFREEHDGGIRWNYSFMMEDARSRSCDGNVVSGHYVLLAGNATNNTVTLKYRNDPRYGGVRLRKTSEDGTLQGFRFLLSGTDPDNSDIQLIRTTDLEGIAEWNDLMPGNYAVTELLEEGSLWEHLDTIYVTVSAEETVEITAFNRLKPGILKIYKTAEDDRFDGVSFRVSGVDNDFFAVIEPDDESLNWENGKQTMQGVLTGLSPGRYTITEICPDRYNTPEPVTVTVYSGLTTEQRFNNTVARGALTVEKQIYAEQFVAAHGNAVFIFKITGLDSGRTYHRVIEFDQNDVDGRTGLVSKSFTLEGLAPGQYTVEELKTLRYEIESVTVTPGGSVSEKVATLRVSRDGERPKVTFVNAVINQEDTSHTALCVNKFDFT
ncbi:MAG: Cys-Gln thioester bond-forming surface protein [Clostridia bacterium]|nr:Cys-Gln thioester bond-forming surface protein [Clostridia bacterium]